MLDALLDPVRYPEFLPGLVAGTVALVVGLLVVVSGVGGTASTRGRPVAGMLLVLAAVGAVAWSGHLGPELPVGLGLLAVSGVAIRRSRAVTSVAGRGGAVAARIGVVLAVGVLARPQPGPAMWLVTVAGGVALIAVLVAFERRSPHAGLAPFLVLVTAGGIYATVPDTEQARALLAAALPLALLGWPWRVARLGPTGALLLGGLVTWVVAIGGVGRPGSVVGALAAAGLLAGDPIARRMAGRTLLDRLPEDWLGGAVVAVLHTAVVLVAARVAGLREGAGEAALVALPLLALVAAGLALARPRARESSV